MFISFRRVGKRKVAPKADTRKGKKEKKVAVKDPNKPKRPPSAFFVFLYELLYVAPLNGYSRAVIDTLMFNFLSFVVVRNSERPSKKKIQLSKPSQQYGLHSTVTTYSLI